jgi:membrane protease YdiL (CAAX protease family)
MIRRLLIYLFIILWSLIGASALVEIYHSAKNHWFTTAAEAAFWVNTLIVAPILLLARQMRLGIVFFWVLTLGIYLSAKTFLDPAHTHAFLLVVMIPFIEELLFRVYLPHFYTLFTTRFTASYLSVCFFSYLHCDPTFTRLFHWDVGLVLGPFLLGCLCQVMWHLTQSFTLIYATHMLANLFALILTFSDDKVL